MNWIERTRINIVGIIHMGKIDRGFKQKNKKDNLLLKGLNRELKQFHIKIKFERYENSPFTTSDVDVIPIILKYVDMCELKANKVFLLSTLRSPGFHQAVPFLIDFYKELLQCYHTPEDELLLLSVCETIGKIRSEKYIEQYINLLNMTITPSAECLINMLSKMPNTIEIENCIFSLIEKENLIPEAWMGGPSEIYKYYCSQTALSYICDMDRQKYHSFIEQFLSPQELSWVHFLNSDCCKDNYS